MSASYTQSASQIKDNIIADSSGISAATAQAILNLLPQDQEAQVDITTYAPNEPLNPDTVVLTVPTGTNLETDPGVGEAIIMSSGTQAQVTFGAESQVKAMVVGDAGGSNVVFANDNNVAVTLTGGEKDSVSTGGGDDSIQFMGGSATINTGAGNDEVTLLNGGTADVRGGDGHMNVWLAPNSPVAATVDGGDGFDRVSIATDRSAHSFKLTEDGKIQMHSDQPVTMTNVNLVLFDTDGDGQVSDLDQVTVLAEDANDSLVAKLYKVALDREPIDGADGWDGTGTPQLGGIAWWTTEYQKLHPDASAEQLAKDFLGARLADGSTEFGNLYANMSNAEFAQALFNNLNEGSANPVAAVNQMTAEQYAQQLDAGLISREDVAFQVANSQEAVQILGIDDIQYVIDNFAQ